MRTIRVHDLTETPDANIVDVREAHEYAYGHLPGALNVPMSQLPLRYQELPMGTTIYLDAAGWDVVNVLGGTQAWINAGYPLENR